MNLRFAALAALSLLALSFAPAGSSHVAGAAFETCGGTAPATTWCTTLVHERGGIDGAFAHAAHPASQPGYTGTILSKASWGGGEHRYYCDFSSGVILQCLQSGTPPPHGAAFVHACFRLTLGLRGETQRGGTGTWSCAVNHSTFPCGGNPLCRL